ncbi:hypothetical protein FisN_37Lh009 [Fistulifera solaris]|uniref:Uncharacterized protein n=1 Tax=Fistulifera solaris TaxID=1519565 RepID=A0A1Z5K0C9_FISSO|nr:hypothetical protein FisN_37Lh009 [Fistulifera solaris]|eukprot:GAX19745.1 hypothetical protein FisN_37Lh009 [Fistulifera solaris]
MPSAAQIMGEPIQLYDQTALLEMDLAKAQGYAILLQGSAEAPRPGGKLSKQSELLAFSALTDGNVIDACFGTLNSKEASEQAQRKVKDVKRILSDGVEQRSFPSVAVQAYAGAFRVVLKYQTAANKLNFLTRCFFYNGIKKTAIQELAESFAELQKAIAALASS